MRADLDSQGQCPEMVAAIVPASVCVRRRAPAEKAFGMEGLTAVPSRSTMASSHSASMQPRPALGAVLDFAKASECYGLFALLTLVVPSALHLAPAQLPVFFLAGSVGRWRVAGGRA